MKYFIALAFVLAIATVKAANINIPAAHMEKAKQFISECMPQFTITDEELNKMIAGENMDGHENAMCFINCFQEKAGILKDGVLQEASVLSKFSTSLGEEKAKAIIEACRGESGTGKCETANKLNQCFKKNGAY